MTPTSGVTVGEWHQLAFARTYATLKKEAILDGALKFSVIDSESAIINAKDLYIFGSATSDGFPAFQGYIRELAIGLPIVDSKFPADLRYYDYYLQQGWSTYFYIRMDEQYKNILVNYVTMESVSMPPTVVYETDSANQILCTPGYFYNTGTSKCQKCVSEYCDYCTAGQANCLDCMKNFWILEPTKCTCMNTKTYRSNTYCLSCDYTCKTCNGYSNSDCTSCDYPLSLSSGKCLCSGGRTAVYGPPHTCAIVCGDSKKHSSEQCEDGNTNNYDGCSSTCQVEPNFKCFGGTTSSPDQCYCDLAISGATFAGGWTRIEATFNKPVTLNSVNYICESILPAALVSLLGTGYSCTMISGGTVLKIELGTNHNFDTNQKLTINANALTISTVTCKNLEFKDIAISPDPMPVTPTAKITGLSLISPCVDMSLSSEQSKSNVFNDPSLTISWDLIDVVPMWEGRDLYFTQLKGYVTGQPVNTKILIIPSSKLMSNKHYTIQLTVTNSAGQSKTTTQQVTTEGAIKPIISWIGSDYEQFFVYQHVVLRVQSYLYKCGNTVSPYTSNNIKFKWQMAEGNIKDFSKTSQNLSYVEFFPYALSPGKQYHISVTAHIPDEPDISASLNTIIDILHGPLVPFIKGGNRTVYKNQSFEIDSSLSYDSSYPSGKINENLQYEWKCESLINDKISECKFLNNTNVLDILAGERKIVFQHSDFQTNSILTFTLIQRDNIRSAESKVSIQILESENNCYFDAPYIYYPLINTVRIKPDSTIILKASIQKYTNPNTAYYWQCIEGPCGGIKFLSSINQEATTVYIPKTEEKKIIFKFSISASNCSSSYSIIGLNINGTPKKGNLQIRPDSGSAMNTKFEIIADNWEDPDNDSPLRYEFSVADNKDFLKAIPLSDQILKNGIQTMLWKPYANSSVLFVKVKVYDSEFSYSEAISEVKIYDDTNPNNYTEYMGYMNEVYNGLSTNNIELYLKDMVIIMKQLNILLDTKKSNELTHLTPNTANPYLLDCQKNCYNSGTCSFNSNLTLFVCNCQPGYSYTSSCLLSLDESLAEQNFRSKILISTLNLALSGPFRPTFIGQKLNIFKEILYDASLISKADKMRIIKDIENELIKTFEASTIFEYSDTNSGFKQNPLYNIENLIVAQEIAEKILTSNRISLCIFHIHITK